MPFFLKDSENSSKKFELPHFSELKLSKTVIK